MTPVETLLAKLSGVKKAGNGWSARCPAHEDRRASLSVSKGDDGTALVKCHAGCDTSAILSAVGLKLADLFPAKAGATPSRNGRPKAAGPTFPTANAAVAELERRHGKRSALWTYQDAEGEPVGVVVRWDRPDGKDIRPVARHGDVWRIGAMPDPRPLYGLPELATARRVVVTEGEKAADKARSLGFTATTSSGGSQAATKTDWRPLAGKEVRMLPDNDQSGRKYDDTVAGILARLKPACVVRIVELPGLPEGGDIVDWIDAHGDAAEPAAMRAEIETLARAVEPWRPADADDLGYRPFPVELLPEPIRGYLTASAAAIGCDPAFIALPLLAALAAAIGSRRRIRLKKRWTEPVIIWALTVATSGSQKSPGFDAAILPVRRRQERARRRYAEALERFAEDMEAYKVALRAWKDAGGEGDKPRAPAKPILERTWTDNTTMEALATLLAENPRGMLLACDELSAWFGSFDRYSKNRTNQDAARWMHLHGGRSFVIDRKTSTPPTIFVENGNVSVAGSIQPGVLRLTFTLEHQENGMAARFLFAKPPKRQKRWTEAEIDEHLEAEVLALFDRLYELQPDLDDDGNPIARIVRLSTSAKHDVWVPFYNEHGAEQITLDDDPSSAWSKLEGYAARLALVHYLVRVAANDSTTSDPDTVDAASMSAGIGLSKWFGHEARRVYAPLRESDVERDQRRLVEWVEGKSGSVTAREVQQGCRWLREPGAAEAALEGLAKAGRGTWEQSPAGQRGRPTRRFELSTVSTVYSNASSPEENSNTVDVDGVDAPTTEAPASETPANLFENTPPAGPYQERA